MAASTSTALLLLLAACAASEEARPAGAMCTAGPEVSVALDPEVRAERNLMQVGRSMRSAIRAPEGEVSEYKKPGPRATSEVKDEVLRLLSGDVKELERLLPSQKSLLTVAFTQEFAVSNSTNAQRKSQGAVVLHRENLGDQDPPWVRGLLYACVGGILLLACLLFRHLLGCWELPGKDQSGSFTMRTSVSRRMDEDVGVLEVWEKQQAPNHLLRLFEEIDEYDQSEVSPPGYINLTDLIHAMEDPRVSAEMVRLGVTFRDSKTVFTMLDTNGDHLVGVQEFIDELLGMGARTHA